MQFIKHNFLENYYNAVRSRDKILQKDLLNDEIAKLIVYDYDGVRNTCLKNGIVVRKIKAKKLAKVVSKDSGQLKKDIINLIIKHNKISEKGQKYLNKNLDFSVLKAEGNNELINDKMIGHDKNKSAILGIIGNNTQVDVKKIVFKSVLITSLCFIGGYLIFNYIKMRKSVVIVKEDGGAIEPQAQASNTKLVSHGNNSGGVSGEQLPLSSESEIPIQ